MIKHSLLALKSIHLFVKHECETEDMAPGGGSEDLVHSLICYWRILQTWGNQLRCSSKKSSKTKCSYRTSNVKHWDNQPFFVVAEQK